MPAHYEEPDPQPRELQTKLAEWVNNRLADGAFKSVELFLRNGRIAARLWFKSPADLVGQQWAKKRPGKP